MIVFSDDSRFFQPSDNTFDSLVIHASQFPHLFSDSTILFHYFTVKAVGYRSAVVRVFHRIIEILYLFLCHSFVEIHCRGGNDIHTCRLVHPLGHHIRVEHYRKDLVECLVGSHAITERHTTRIYSFHNGDKVFLREFRYDLVLRIVMMDTIGHPYPFQVGLELFPLVG
ncbi:hypothetical protein SDC9_139240 [bioreactor metagenome]|uniref:Uncharacterized protein n=1 Tax=bioreactor metagenome TaxID=1076179 RepID=A0A645DS06_9ZZZZ